VTAAFLKVLAALVDAENDRKTSARNILRALSTHTRRTKVVELSSGTHRVPEELRRHTLQDVEGHQYSTNLDRNRYGSDDNYLSTVIRFNLEFLGLCPSTVDVEIIDSKNRGKGQLVSVGAAGCTCHGGGAPGGAAARVGRAPAAAFDPAPARGGSAYEERDAERARGPSLRERGSVLEEGAPSGSLFDALVIAATEDAEGVESGPADDGDADGRAPSRRASRLGKVSRPFDGRGPSGPEAKRPHLGWGSRRSADERSDSGTGAGGGTVALLREENLRLQMALRAMEEQARALAQRAADEATVRLEMQSLLGLLQGGDQAALQEVARLKVLLHEQEQAFAALQRHVVTLAGGGHPGGGLAPLGLLQALAGQQGALAGQLPGGGGDGLGVHPVFQLPGRLEEGNAGAAGAREMPERNGSNQNGEEGGEQASSEKSASQAQIKADGDGAGQESEGGEDNTRPVGAEPPAGPQLDVPPHPSERGPAPAAPDFLSMLPPGGLPSAMQLFAAHQQQGSLDALFAALSRGGAAPGAPAMGLGPLGDGVAHPPRGAGMPAKGEGGSGGGSAKGTSELDGAPEEGGDEEGTADVKVAGDPDAGVTDSPQVPPAAGAGRLTATPV